MLKERNVSYLEYASIGFCSLCLFYFLIICCFCFFPKKAGKTEYPSELRNFEIYELTLQKYNAKIIDLKVVSGYVEAFIKKDGFDYEQFNKCEPYFIETVDNHYVITFKITKKLDEKKNIQLSETNEERISIDSACFLSKNNWFITINGKQFDHNNKKIDERTEVISVTEDRAIIQIDGEYKEFLLF